MAANQPSGPILKDLGLDAMRAKLRQLGQQKITIGHQGASGRAQHPGADASIGQVAAWMEFGTPGSDNRAYDQPGKRVPSRPFVRTTFDREQQAINVAVRSGMSDLIDGRKTLTEVQDAVGTVMVARLRETINQARSWATPLAESTIAKKGHDLPLLETWTLYRRASWAVRDGDTILRQGGEQ